MRSPAHVRASGEYRATARFVKKGEEKIKRTKYDRERRRALAIRFAPTRYYFAIDPRRRAKFDARWKLIARGHRLIIFES